jgi:hypothetical protein
MRDLYKKATFEDKFIRKFYCENARKNYVKFIKRFNKRKLRRLLKSEQQENIDS